MVTPKQCGCNILGMPYWSTAHQFPCCTIKGIMLQPSTGLLQQECYNVFRVRNYIPYKLYTKVLWLKLKYFNFWFFPSLRIFNLSKQIQIDWVVEL
jgi:hypothetical protein